MNLIENEHAPASYEAGDEAHYDALENTGFFGSQGAGIIPMAKTTGRIMLVLRSPQVEQPGSWGNVGGAHHADETPVAAARREMHEETGYSRTLSMIPLLVFQKDSFRYCNFLGIVEDEFTPDLGWEATAFKWVQLGGDYPTPLHFGIQSVLADSASMRTMQHYANLFNPEE